MCQYGKKFQHNPAAEGVIGSVVDLSVILIRFFGSLLLVPMRET
jgi:hypothetical protein